MVGSLPPAARRGARCGRADSSAAAGQRFHFVPHHLAHAASAYFPSGFDRAAILTIDGVGEVACSTLARAVGTRIQMLETFNYPHSLGFVWEVCMLMPHHGMSRECH